MSVVLTKPTIGSTGWGQNVNDNFTAIENGFNGGTEIGPLKLADGGWVGLGSSSERIVFADGELSHEVKLDGIHKFNSIVDMQMWPITNVDWMAADTIYSVTEGERVNIPDGVDWADGKYTEWDGTDVVRSTDSGTHKFTGGDVVASGVAFDWSAGESKPLWYSQAGEPNITNDTWALWEDTDDSSWWMLIDKSGTQKKVELASHARKHDIDSASEHTGVSEATEDNFVAFDASGLPKDSERKHSDYALSGHNHDAVYPGIVDPETITGAWAFSAMQNVTFAASKVLDLHANSAVAKLRLIEAATEPTLNANETAWWYDTSNTKMYLGVNDGSSQFWVEAGV